MKYGNRKLIFFKEYNTLTYDLLGHGKTPLKKSKVTFDDFSQQLLNLINELKFKKIHLVGFFIRCSCCQGISLQNIMIGYVH